MKLPIYMDNHATTPVDPRVLDAMLPFFVEQFGNASSKNHAFGWRAEEAVDDARARVAALIGASEKDLLFTSGATESNNLAIKGVALAYRDKGDQIVTVATEHKAILDPCKRLEKDGFRITYLPVDADGFVSPDAVRAAVTDKTILVSVMLANNEIGVIQPLAEIGRITKERGILLHSDATQAVGKIPVSVDALGVDLLSLSAHKMYGPKGVGALYIRGRNPRVRLTPIAEGGGQERGLRSGTLNVPGIVGMGAACAIASDVMRDEAERTRRLRDRLRAGLEERIEGITVNGGLADRLPNNLNVSFSFVEGESLIMGLDDVAVSSGSACTSASVEPSHVLRALPDGDARANSSVRFGLGRFNTEEEIEYVIGRVADVVKRLRALSPLYDGPARTVTTEERTWSH